MSRSMSHGSMAQVATIYRGYPAKSAVNGERCRLEWPFGANETASRTCFFARRRHDVIQDRAGCLRARPMASSSSSTVTRLSLPRWVRIPSTRDQGPFSWSSGTVSNGVRTVIAEDASRFARTSMSREAAGIATVRILACGS